MEFYEKNLFSEKTELFSKYHQDQRLTEKLEELFTPKPFAERWKGANIACIVLSYICNVLSSITALGVLFYVLYLSFLPTFGSFKSSILGGLTSVVLVAIIETLKRTSSNNLIRSIIQFKRFSLPLMVVVVLACSGSVVTSFYGARQIGTSMDQRPIKAEVNLLDLGKIEEGFDQSISEKRKSINSIRKENTYENGRISRTARGTISDLEQGISGLERQKLAEVKFARQRNDSLNSQMNSQYLGAVAEQDLQTANRTSLLGYVALSFEFTFLCCLVFSWFYYWTCYKERFAINNDTNENRNEPATIGAEEANNQSKSETNENRNEGKKRTCSHCSKSYEHKHHKQKYCSDNCRINAWQIRTGKKLAIKT